MGETPGRRIGQIVLKAHSRCDLDCDYCYVYKLGDQSWRDQPKLMTGETVDALGDRLAAYLDVDDPQLVIELTFHGGEPTLAPPEFFANTVAKVRSKVGNKTVVQCGVQTNANRLGEEGIGQEYLEVFRENSIRVGVSLDGGPDANVHRVNRRGEPTYEATVKGILAMQESSRYRKLFSGILAVINLESDPIETYKSLRELDPPAIDFLLPHGNWITPPPGLETQEARDEAPYAAWLGAIFDKWYPDDAKWLRIRTFDSRLSLLAGGKSSVESIGTGAETHLVVVETDGSYELVDTLKSSPGRVAKTGLNVYEHSLQEAALYMEEKLRSIGGGALAVVCQKCPIGAQCGGGYLPHRAAQDGFGHQSVFCKDLAGSFAHMYGRLTEGALGKKILSHIDSYYTTTASGVVLQ